MSELSVIWDTSALMWRPWNGLADKLLGTRHRYDVSLQYKVWPLKYGHGFVVVISMAYVRMQWLQCVSNGVTTVLHLAIVITDWYRFHVVYSPYIYCATGFWDKRTIAPTSISQGYRGNWLKPNISVHAQCAYLIGCTVVTVEMKYLMEKPA